MPTVRVVSSKLDASDLFQLLLGHCHRQGSFAAADVVLRREEEQRRDGEGADHHHERCDGGFDQGETALALVGFGFGSSWFS